MKIRLYGHKTVGWGFKQITIWPGICVVVSTMNPDSTMMILGANMLIWDIGIIVTWEK